MAKIITIENKSKFEQELASMFAERKRIFVDLLKWKIPVTNDRYEIDQFDDDVAI